MHTDLSPLSPIQKGMLFHWLLDPHSGTDIEQIVGDLDEAIDPERLWQAWQRVLNGVSVLRTAFVWEGRPDPAQGIAAATTVPFRFEDLSNVDAGHAERTIASFLDRDRTEGFDLGRAPAMRVTLFRLEPTKHRMIWTFHHILIDGRSFETILSEVFDGYRDGADTPLPSGIDRPYSTYAEWTAQQDPAAARAFWQEKLRGFTAPTPLPGGHALQADGTQFGESETHLSAELTRGLRELAARGGLSLNTLVMSAWALLLARYSGESEVVFGATKTTRRGTIPDADATPGLFLATIPVRVKVDDNLPVRDWLQRVRAEWLSFRGYEHLPLADIKSVSEIPSSGALFETLVVFENYHFGTRLTAKGGAWSQRRFHIREQAGLPLTLLAYGDDELVIKMDYDGRRFERADINRMIHQLVEILASWVADDAQPLCRTALLPPAERELVVRTWNATDVVWPDDATLATLLTRQALATPDAVAVVAEDGSLTYRELHERAAVVARFLRARGVGAGELVAVCMERSTALMVALVGVLHAGGAYVPLDPDYPAERLAYMLEDSGARWVLTHRRAAAQLPAASAAERVFLDEQWDAIARDAARGGAASPEREIDPAQPAYMIYTSGSTGRPKGAVNAHRGIVNRLRWMQETYTLGALDVVLQKTPVSFDVSVWELFWPLLTGAKLVLAAPGGHRDPAYLAETIQQRGVTVCHFVPSMLQVFLTEQSARGCARTLRDVMCSGEALTYDLQERFFATLPGVRLHNLYGPTECAVDVTFWECVPGDARRMVPIGRPLANTRMYVLDGANAPVPIGVAGELYIAGVQVGLGYHNRPELTAERFVPDPFARDPRARMYRTGDLARWLPDGVLEYLGRTDHQIKLRGLRIELGEIEAALLGQPGVAQAVVVAREDMPGDRRLVAYVVADREVTLPDATALRSALKTTLPDYMLPSAIVALEAMPLTANGKVDRKALPAPAVVSEPGQVGVAPRTPVEQMIADIWSEVLRVSNPGVFDDFFELGGHSILAMQVLSRLRASFGVDMPLQRLFEVRTIEALALAVTELQMQAHGDDELLRLLAELDA